MKMDDKFVLDRYTYELSRKEELNAALTLPLALSAPQRVPGQ